MKDYRTNRNKSKSVSLQGKTSISFWWFHGKRSLYDLFYVT